MQVSKDYYILNFLFVCLAFYLFVFIITIFGYIFFYYIKRYNKEDWELNLLEAFIICFAIGLSVYISFSFILDIFQFFNSFSAYYSLIIIDSLFIIHLIYRGELNRKKISNFTNSIKTEFKRQPKKAITLIIIISFVIALQIWMQWGAITQEYAIPSKDTYIWLGQSWHLLENGYLYRENMPLHYPQGYTFFLAGPVLIYPDWRLAYFYMKFAGIPLFSLYIIVLFGIFKRVFKENYMILLGLFLTLISNYLFSRFSPFASSSITPLLILIGMIIIISKCPFYLNGFLITSLFFFNALFALFYLILLTSLLILRLLTENWKFKTLLIEDIAKTLIIVAIILFPWALHLMIVKNLSFLDLILAFLRAFGAPISLSKNIISPYPTGYLLQFRYLLKNLFPHNDIIFIFLDLEKRLLSYFIIFAFIAIFIPAEKYFNKNYSEIVNFGKLALLIILGLYIAEIIFEGSSNIFAMNLVWFKHRAVEAFSGPVILLSCFAIEKVIEKSKLITIYLKNNYSSYRNLIKNDILSKFLKMENVIITLLLISTFSTLVAHERIYMNYYFEQDQIDTVFYIKENVPKNSKILVSDFNDGPNCLYSTLYTYRIYKWDFEFEDNTFNETLAYIREKDIEYILLDHTMINSTEESYFTGYSGFDKLYENEYNFVFEVEA